MCFHGILKIHLAITESAMPKAKTRLEVLQVSTLLKCVYTGDQIQIKKIIESGVPDIINYQEPKDGETALTVAAAANNDDMVKFLLEVGASPDACDSRGRTPVMRGAEYGHVQTVQMLADARANMKLRDYEGKGLERKQISVISKISAH